MTFSAFSLDTALLYERCSGFSHPVDSRVVRRHVDHACPHLGAQTMPEINAGVVLIAVP